MKFYKTRLLTATTLLLAIITPQANAAIALDRTRVIFDGANKSVSMNVSNENKTLPYLAQGWIEDESGNKITSPLIVLPPVQRIEAGAKSQVKVQGLPALQQLPQDRESLFYFNLREIPPRSEQANTLQIALQTRIKLFYRPKAIEPTKADLDTPWQQKLTLTRQGNNYIVNNPTPYYVTIVGASATAGADSVKGFEPLMLDPKSNSPLGASVSALGSSPILAYVNDYGGRPNLVFHCSGDSCKTVLVKSK